MNVMKLIPASKDYLWGGRKLIEKYGKPETKSGIMAESWELSCHPDGENIIADGNYAGKTLTEYLMALDGEPLGENCRQFGGKMPVLVKLIDAAAPLSVQVHPSDAYAKAHENQNGKTEMWHVVDCDEGAAIYYGLKETVTREQYAEAVRNGGILELLNRVEVKQGDTYFIEAGTVHAIGAGMLIAEVQQNSNVTYRVYDYDRVDAAGQPRQLHREQAIEVSRLTPNPERYDFGGHLACCKYFCVDRLAVDGSFRDAVGKDSFVSLLAVTGEGTLHCGDEAVKFLAGESLLLIAGAGEYTISGNATLLKTTVPPAKKRYRIGIDLGGTNIKIGIVDDKNTIVAKKSIKTLVQRPWREVANDMSRGVLLLLSENNISVGDCRSLGIGSPGTVDAATGTVVYSNNFFWENIPLVDELKKYIDLPMAITNDANCAALGEVVAGAAAGCHNAVLITLGTGVGGGVIIGGKVFEGGFAGGAELGHTTVVSGGEPCTCGRRGCFESYASATALIRQAQEAARQNPSSALNTLCGGNLDKMNGKLPFDAAESGDGIAKQVVENYINWLGEGIVNMINIFRPEKVILSGGVCAQGGNLTAPLNRYTQRYCFGGDKVFVAPVVIAELGNDAGIIGAANLVQSAV